MEYSNWGPSVLGLLYSLEGAPFQSLCADKLLVILKQSATAASLLQGADYVLRASLAM
ncbi:hypothetical protein ACFQDN_22305 [Pseudomonas asuensis]|uniref:hypothetical protein n=1 Tax=Pseudomonas asuensis TaxID=1825787 RepID=UPI00166476D0|nr:hypothetical protein [Pseudomonas asuensis]